MTSSGMADTARIFIYERVAACGAVPTSAEIAAHCGVPRDDARALLRQLAAERKLILDARSGEVWMCAPFSAVPTRFRVHGEGVSWWANCAWDMLGIPASLGCAARVEASCACCDEPMFVDVAAERGPTAGEGLVHIFLPARRWYDDIGFT